jgi:DUF305 family protein family protein
MGGYGLSDTLGKAKAIVDSAGATRTGGVGARGSVSEAGSPSGDGCSATAGLDTSRLALYQDDYTFCSKLTKFNAPHKDRPMTWYMLGRNPARTGSHVTRTALLLFALILAAAAWAADERGMGGAMPGHGAGAGMATPFATMMETAMTVMDDGMKHAPMTGDPDHDFAAMMIPHHQGAIDMAKAELLYGKNPVLRRLAQEIVVTQNSEITVMQMELQK